MTLFLIGFLPSYLFLVNNGCLNSKNRKEEQQTRATISEY
jgi:hypothetical protein